MMFLWNAVLSNSLQRNVIIILHVHIKTLKLTSLQKSVIQIKNSSNQLSS